MLGARHIRIQDPRVLSVGSSWIAVEVTGIDSLKKGDPKTGHISKNFNEYNDQIGRLRKAVPKMIFQLGGFHLVRTVGRRGESPVAGLRHASHAGHDRS